MEHWRIPGLWQGGTVGVLASGPSMSKALADRMRAAGVPCIVINQTYELMLDAALLYGADSSWWGANPGAMKFSGLRVSVEPMKGVLWLKNLGVVGYSDDPTGVHTLGNSGAQGIQIAAKAGASRIILLGFDMSGSHWHAPHKAPLRETTPEVFTRWLGRFPALADALAKRGIEVINCTPGSALKCWPIMSLDEVLETCR